MYTFDSLFLEILAGTGLVCADNLLRKLEHNKSLIKRKWDILSGRQVSSKHGGRILCLGTNRETSKGFEFTHSRTIQSSML